MKIAVIGAGGWGTALSLLADTKNDVVLWSNFEEEAKKIRESGENTDYLPGVKIPSSIEVTSDTSCVKGCEIVLFVPPSKFFRGVAEKFKPLIARHHILVSATKGFEFETGFRMSEVLSDVMGIGRDVVLSGPTHAEEVARGVPTAMVAASNDEEAASVVQDAFSTENMRVYRHHDVIGTEVSGAAKNVIAIAAGMLRGLGFGDNTMAALITRGLAEIRRLGIQMGAELQTFSGLAGMGDLFVTCSSPHSRNGRVGEALAKGQSIDEILSGMKMVAEGVETAKAMVKFEDELKVSLPISRAVYEVIFEKKSPKAALIELMNRPLRHEFD